MTAFFQPAGGSVSYSFRVPKRGIFTPSDLKSFTSSPLHAEIVGFVKACAEAVTGVDLELEDIATSPVALIEKCYNSDFYVYLIFT
jgi:hypothetical protein